MVNHGSREAVVVVVTTCQTIGEVVTSWGPGDGGDGENSDGGDGENSYGENCDGDGDNGYVDKL